jgi:hypothetical protein
MWLFPQYRDIVRQFIKGTDGFSGGFAECLCGSPHLYQVCRANTCKSIQWNVTWISCCIWPRIITLLLIYRFWKPTCEWRNIGLFSYLLIYFWWLIHFKNPVISFLWSENKPYDDRQKNSYIGNEINLTLCVVSYIDKTVSVFPLKKWNQPFCQCEVSIIPTYRRKR